MWLEECGLESLVRLTVKVEKDCWRPSVMSVVRSRLDIC